MTGSQAMLIGVPKEIKVLENRVGLTPASVRELVHHVIVAAVQRLKRYAETGKPTP